MKQRIVKLVRRALLLILGAALFAGVVVWNFLFRPCASPNSPNPVTQNTIEFNCHGAIVFIDPFQNFLDHWLNHIVLGVLMLFFIVQKWQPTSRLPEGLPPPDDDSRSA